MTHQASWESLFEGRRVLIAPLPPPSVVRMRVPLRLLLRLTALLFVLAAATGLGYVFWNLSGRWWVGFAVFSLLAWIALIIGFGIIDTMRLGRADRQKRYERAMEHPISRLLPQRGLKRDEVLNPAKYTALFALDPRPILLFDEALATTAGAEDMVGALAPLGHLPEPEPLQSSKFRPGSGVGGILMISQGFRFIMQAFSSVFNGAPLGWEAWLGIVMFLMGMLLLLQDPWLRRKLGLPKMFGSDPELGAGWIRTVEGEVYTVEDSIVMMTLEANAVEVRCIRHDRVECFFLPILYTSSSRKAKSSTFGVRAKLGAAANRVAGEVREAVDAAAKHESKEMPTTDEPLRLLLSSWTYPAPRAELAPPPDFAAQAKRDYRGPLNRYFSRERR
ncbi:MAG: hypothetical protein DWI11_00250 [Planctomycetota bacterium]|nr:MAG: hypothetical protein DWI11_00250 [Planctomycetota bacterium]